MPVAAPPKRKSKSTDGAPPGFQRILWPDGSNRAYQVDARWRPWQAALYHFGITQHGEAKLEHWRNFVTWMWPEPIFIWDDWSSLFFGALCGAKETVERLTGAKIETEERWWRNVIFTGGAATGKSAKAALWAYGNWLVSQQHTTCMLTSTTREMLEKRIWADILLWHEKTPEKKSVSADLIPSDLEMRWNPRDEKGVIKGIAVKSGGDVDEAVDRIKGIHNRRMFDFIDEMTSAKPAVVTACRNHNKGVQEYQLIGLANARKHDDPHGERSEPIGGWNSISVDTSFWLTPYGCAVHFDALKSPAIADPERFYFYPTKQQLEEDAKEKGGMNSAEWWSGVRGFWPPTGISTNIMDEALLEQFRTREPAIWKSGFSMGAGFDPAFEGGDRRVLYPFKWGQFANGLTGLEFLPPVIPEIDLTADVRWIHYLIADAVQKACEGYVVDGKPRPIPPEHFIMDTTGEGGGLFSVMSGRWSAAIASVEFGGAAEKTQIFPDRPTTWHELYGNKVTMLWYGFRRFVEGDQVRGLDHPETRRELTARDKEMRGGKTCVVPKKKMREQGMRSPDLADAAVLATEFLRRKGIGFSGSTGGDLAISRDAWNAFADRTNLDDEERDYSSENSAFV